MLRKWSLCFLAVTIGAAGVVATRADDKQPRNQIKDGIEGKVRKVDLENNKLTIVTDQGRERTFTITDETMLAGPRGGKVRRHLKDPRFHAGFPVTIVAEGTTASEVHLGFAHEPGTEKDSTPKPTETRPMGKALEAAKARAAEKAAAAKDAARGKAATALKPQEAKKLQEEDDEEEIPGKIKSFDASKRILVVSLLNGNTRSFILPANVPVEVGGKESTKGLKDPALKVGATVTVMTDDSGRKVKEVKVVEHKWFRRAS